ncbi:MAG: glucose-6-phosphate isomerase [Planctomycetota bacterium]|nr:glucose-6-phosphate isomerase [Planctomycetota bacterium]
MLTLDYANCLSSRVGQHGLDPARLDRGSDFAKAAAHLTERLATSRGTGWEKWRDLAKDPARAEYTGAVRKVVAECQGRFDNLVVLGIGGSALGNIALQAALNPASYNLCDPRGGAFQAPSGAANSPGRSTPRVFVVDNVDPAYLGSILDTCRQLGGLERTLFNIVSKSGETAETASQFMIVRAMLKDALGDHFHRNIVAITDPAKGTMRTICDADGYATLPVPEGVGGRFSVLSPVGLFSAAMAGIDIDGLLDGAEAMDQRCTNPDITKNPAAMLATLLVDLGLRKGKTNHVLMPYCNGLYLLADWFRQLWAESLGKRVNLDGETVYAGFTPIKALGTTDQHSQVQLYREGPNDKVFGLIEVADFGEADITIPTGLVGELGVEALSYLEGTTLATLLAAEKRATEFALLESQRPNFTLSFPTLDAHHVGEFLMLWQIVTAYAGLMLNIDAYDQPAVETGKQATFGLMGRAGFGEWKAKVDTALAETPYRM